MKANRRRFIQALGTSAAGVAMSVPAGAADPSKDTAKGNEGQILLVGDNIALTTTQYGKVRGYVLRGIHYFLGMPYGADTSGANRFMPPQKPKPWTRCISGALVGQHRAAEHGEPVRQQVRFLPRSLELRRRQRGLSPDQRLHAQRKRRQEAAGPVLDPRRRVHEWQRDRTGRLQRRELRPHGQRGLLLHQPPAGSFGLLQSRRRRRREVRRVRQRGHAGHRGCPRVGSRQHRQLRRRSGQRHHHGAVRRRRQGLHPHRDAFGQGVVPQSRGAERSLPESRGEKSLPRSWARRW